MAPPGEELSKHPVWGTLAVGRHTVNEQGGDFPAQAKLCDGVGEKASDAPPPCRESGRAAPPQSACSLRAGTWSLCGHDVSGGGNKKRLILLAQVFLSQGPN